MNASAYQTWIELSKSSLIHNVSVTRRALSQNTKLFAVVKANAYGHGFEPVIQTIAPYVDGFCVASTDEALRAHALKIEKRIIVVSYFTTLNAEHLSLLSKSNIEIPIFCFSILNALIQSKLPFFVHIKFDTGTSRIGFTSADIPKLAQKMSKNPQLQIRGIYSHFADAEDFESNFPRTQLLRFSEYFDSFFKLFHGTGKKEIERHIACSAGITRFPDSHFDAVRLGIHLYGLSGILDQKKAPKIRPVLSWKTKIIQIKTVQKGETIGYNRTYTATHTQQIAVIPVGYWDGLDRELSNNGFATIRNVPAPIRGMICMNICMLDVTNVPDVSEGDEVTLIGQQTGNMTALRMAKSVGTIHYEIVTRINPLIPRILC